LVMVMPDSYKALLEQQEAAISSAKATNLQQKATMMKTEQDLKRADDMYSKTTISIQEYNTAQAAYDVAKNTFESSLHEIERSQISRHRLPDRQHRNDNGRGHAGRSHKLPRQDSNRRSRRAVETRAELHG